MNDLRFEEYFLFTQHSLATFQSCPLKFKKRYLENLKWESIPDEKIRIALERGRDFHLLAQRYFLGVETGLRQDVEEYGSLEPWVTKLTGTFPLKPDERYLPEHKLRMVSGGIKLEANFDLLVVKDKSIDIWDWKTHSSNPVRQKTYARRLSESLQTIVYMFVLKEQARLVIGQPIPAESICMHYWQPEPPYNLAEIRYSEELHKEFEQALRNRLQRIYEYDYSDFDKSQYRESCKFCEFNWYCNNETIDFNALQEDEELLDSLIWDMVEEIY